MFWRKLESEGLNFIRKEPLQFALKKGWFYNVHQPMEARKNWEAIIAGKYLEDRYSEIQIEYLGNLIQAEEFKRLKEIRNALKNKRISFSNQLRFGDTMAFFRHCNLLKKYFTFWEIDEINQIWSASNHMPEI